MDDDEEDYINIRTHIVCGIMVYDSMHDMILAGLWEDKKNEVRKLLQSI